MIFLGERKIQAPDPPTGMYVMRTYGVTVDFPEGPEEEPRVLIGSLIYGGEDLASLLIYKDGNLTFQHAVKAGSPKAIVIEQFDMERVINRQEVIAGSGE